MHTNDDSTSSNFNDIRMLSEQEANGSGFENSTAVPIAQVLQIAQICQSLQKEVASLKEELFSQKQIVAKNTESICELQQLFEKQITDKQKDSRSHKRKREDGNVDILEVTRSQFFNQIIFLSSIPCFTHSVSRWSNHVSSIPCFTHSVSRWSKHVFRICLFFLPTLSFLYFLVYFVTLTETAVLMFLGHRVFPSYGCFSSEFASFYQDVVISCCYFCCCRSLINVNTFKSYKR
jgi:hypothetical protein